MATGSRCLRTSSCISPPDNPGWAVPRPLTTLLGIQPEAPVLPKPNNPEMFFYRTRGDRGYNVPVKFLDYLAAHGGMEETAGPPIGEYNHWKGELFRQCFVNLCLIENPTETGLLRIHPDAMGYAYLEMIGRPVFQLQPTEDLQPTLEEYIGHFPRKNHRLKRQPHILNRNRVASQNNKPTETLPPPAARSTPNPRQAAIWRSRSGKPLPRYLPPRRKK